MHSSLAIAMHAQQLAQPPRCARQAARSTAGLRQRAAARPVAPPRRREWRCYAAQTELQEWDVVLFDGPDGTMALGRISQIRGGELSVERLEEGQDELQSVWVLHGADEETIACTAVRRIVAADYMQVVDPDRVSNPHGEHALEAYRLLEPLEPLQQGRQQQEEQQQDEQQQQEDAP